MNQADTISHHAGKCIITLKKWQITVRWFTNASLGLSENKKSNNLELLIATHDEWENSRKK